MTFGAGNVVRRGRPWAETAVWGALWLLSAGETPDWLADHQPSRIRRRLQSLDTSGLIWAARKRAEIRRFRATENVLDAIKAHVVLGGTRALGLETDPPHLHAYVTRERFQWLTKDFPVVPDENAGNLTLFVSDLAASVGNRLIPASFAAIDLSESNEPSEAEGGMLLLDDLLRKYKGERRDWHTIAETADVIRGENDEVFAVRLLARALSDARVLTDPVDVIRFLQKPASTGDQRWDVLLASAVSRECRLRGIDAPAWTNVEGLEPWWFPALLDETLIPLTVQMTPPELARKGIWLDERALTTV
jgi:hypothetical protein